MTWVHRIDGAPGAGKTYTLLNKIGAERERGVDVDDMLFLTFTNAARLDAKAEIRNRFSGLSRGDVDDLVRTTHSAALGAVSEAGIIGQDDIIIQEGDDPYFELFAEQHGMNYGGTSIADLESGGDIKGNGDVFFALNSWLAATYRDASDARLAPVKFPWLDIDTFRHLQREWKEYKRIAESEGRLWEHHEYIEAAIDNNVYPIADVMLIDEFQDFSPLQYKYYKDMRDNGNIERIYLAGDPQQSIYSFRGADPYYFEETDFDKSTVLDQTRRCRGEVATLARKLLESSEQNKSRDFTAVNGGGTVRSIRGDASNVEAAIETAITTDTDTLLLLTRTNKQWRRLARFLRKKGFPYGVLGSRGWSMWNHGENAAIMQALVSIREKTSVDGMRMAQLVKSLPANMVSNEHLEMERIDGEHKYTAESAQHALGSAGNVTDIARKLQIKEPYRKAIENVLARGNANRKSQIRVGTIHASKGLEADGVLLFPAYSTAMHDRYTGDPFVKAEEHRVAYVAATRARDRLYIVRSFFGSKPTMPMFDKPAVREVAV